MTNQRKKLILIIGVVVLFIILIAAQVILRNYLIADDPIEPESKPIVSKPNPLITDLNPRSKKTSPSISHFNLMRGPSDAKITIIEYSDFTCEFCKKIQPVIKQVLDEYPQDVRLVWKDLPSTNNQASMLAHRSGRCAAEQQVFWPMHDLLFQLEEVTDETVLGLARALNLDLDQFKSCVINPNVDVLIQHDLNEASDLGIAGTPFFYINEHAFLGEVSYNEFKNEIENILNSNEE